MPRNLQQVAVTQDTYHVSQGAANISSSRDTSQASESSQIYFVVIRVASVPCDPASKARAKLQNGPVITQTATGSNSIINDIDADATVGIKHIKTNQQNDPDLASEEAPEKLLPQL